MEELERTIYNERWTPKKLSPPPEPPYIQAFKRKERISRKLSCIQEVSRYIRVVDDSSSYEVGMEEWKEIAEHMVRVDEDEATEIILKTKLQTDSHVKYGH